MVSPDIIVYVSAIRITRMEMRISMVYGNVSYSRTRIIIIHAPIIASARPLPVFKCGSVHALMHEVSFPIVNLRLEATRTLKADTTEKGEIARSLFIRCLVCDQRE